jgi:hypothetical protein
MFPDQAWDTALKNWQPTGSFHKPLPTPVHGPAGGTLVQLPCINQEWVLLLMGCLSQLQNPLIWGSIADSIRDQVLSWVTQLQEMMWSGMDVPCCNVQMRLTSECLLQFSVDGGTTWSTVTNWSTNFCTCVQSCIVSPVPPIPPGPSVNQHACNIAGFLATDIIKVAMEKIVAYVGTTTQEVQFATDVLGTIGFAFPITYAASIAFKDWYNSVVGQVLAQVEAARDDATLWSLVTCAIYNAIKNDGHVTAGNFAAVHANLAAMSYTYAWVPSVIAAWWNDLGLTNVQAAQNVGAFDVVDCSGCGIWCLEYDFSVSAQGWQKFAGTAGAYVPGAPGYWTSQDAGGFQQLNIYLDLSAPVVINEMTAIIEVGGAAAGGTTREFALRNVSHTVLATAAYSSGIISPPGVVTGAFANVNAQEINFIYQSTGADNFPMTVRKIQVKGPGPNPFGLDDCTY